ncbi:MAG: carbohydrate binding family 9 domain-containing protein, partial [Candidatus Marinimicrobia bacterium]|nr:carbohydrate binding family 9 domain-containing protein [Candidatus Neomarinimicrobiota bacterium]
FANTSLKTIEVKKINGEKIYLDGKVDELAWIFTDNSSEFIQRDPFEGDPSTESTSFSILYDDENLYVAIKALTTDNSKIRGILSRRDEESPSDWLFVSIDSYNDNRTAFEFGLNPAGVKRDLRRFDDDNQDTNWDANWEGKTSIDKDGWYAEFKIPFIELRFDNNGKKTWGIQIHRYIAENNEEAYWSFWPKDVNGYVQHYGDLIGLEDIPTQRRVYIMPYVTGSYKKTDDLRTLVHPNSYNYAENIGLDAKIGITNNLTFDLTVNPDFGQVEADPAELNLSAFESYFQEKRPFFIEGGNIFNFSLGLGDGDQSTNSLFYTRRIGRAPHDYAEDDDGYETNPSSTRILSAGKISGKTSNGWSIGVLDAITRKEIGTVKFANGTPTINQTVEPLTNYFVSRIQKDLREGKTTVGGIFTATNRNIEDEHLDYLHNKAYTTGIDFDHYIFNDKYELEGAFAFSDVYGSEEAIFETQTNSRHYFQRPNANHLNVDSLATNLKGFG